MAWFVLLSSLLAVGAACAVGMYYVVRQAHRFRPIKKLMKTHRLAAHAVAFSPVIVCALFSIIRIVAMYTVMLHLAAFWVICDVVGLFLNKLKLRRKRRARANGVKPKKRRRRRYIAGYFAIVITVVYLSVGWYNAHHVWMTRYDLKTDKDIGGQLHVVMLADSHIGITLDGEQFAEQMERVSALEPDVLLVPGDFVDDDTTTKDMKRACEALGEVKTKYGVYFSEGNHDPGFFGYRNFDLDELESQLAKNGVVVLADEVEEVDGRFQLVGRKDRSTPDRAEFSQLAGECADDVYSIVLDHQPNDYAAEVAESPDLVLSGHTHGGHIFPAGFFGKLFGFNDRVYGIEQRGDTTFIVTSGISGWSIPFKTGCISEIVDIYITE